MGTNGVSVVLVHGAWADGSSWISVISPLIAGGHKVRVTRSDINDQAFLAITPESGKRFDDAVHVRGSFPLQP